jgi:hypothetical protein
VFSTSSAILIALIVPIAILIVSAILSMKRSVYRRNIGRAVAIIGVLEMVGFFMFSITLGYIVYRIPYEARVIIFLQGLSTVLGGLLTFSSSKPKKTKDIRKIA